MALPTALRDLPGDLIPPGLAGAEGRERVLAEVLFEQRRVESAGYCRTMTAVYALHRAMYADDEAEYLAQSATFVDAVQARRELTAAGTALEAQVSTSLRLGPAAARLAIETAVGFVERLPKVFALIGQNVISPKAGEAALRRSHALDEVQVRRFDELLADRLTADFEVLSLPALREAADLIVNQIDAEAAERRRRAAIEDRRVTFRPEEDGMAAVFALLPAEDGMEVQARVDHIAGTVCDADPRTLPQRRADGWVQLTRGFSTLGCQCEVPNCRYREARFHGESDADGVITRFVTLINVVINERDMAPTGGQSGGAAAEGKRRGPGYLVGFGPITLEHALELAGREDARVRPFGQRLEELEKSEPPVDRVGLHDPDPRGCLDVTRLWAEIVVLLEGHSGPGDGWSFDGPAGPAGPPDGGPPGGPPRASGVDPETTADPTCGSDGTCPDPMSADESGRAGRAPVVTARGSTGYRPSADLRRYLRLVFPRCVFPYCTRPASRAQLDHRREFDHRDPALGGETSADELQPLCVAHHQLKTAGEWIDARLSDGRILWTSPDGRRYIVDPSGTVLALFPDLKRVRWIVPERAAISKQDAAHPGGRTRLQREHARRERLRQRNVAAMQAELDRAKTPISTLEENLAAALGAPQARPVPTCDGPPPY